MATYVISDIHGEYDMFLELLDKIGLREEDTLYILGYVLDRGPHPIKALLMLMKMPNVVCLAGNHELMALECLEFLRKEITDVSIGELDEKMLDNLITTGVYRFPVKLAANIAVKTVSRFLEDNPDSFDIVEWVLFDSATENAYEIEVQTRI